MLVQTFRWKFVRKAHTTEQIADLQAKGAPECLIKRKDEESYEDGTVVSLNPPFGVHIHVSLFGGEKVISWVGYGGHIAGCKIIITKVDDSCEVIDMGTGQGKSSEEFYDAVTAEFLKHVPEGAYKAVKSILRLEK